MIESRLNDILRLRQLRGVELATMLYCSGHPECISTFNVTKDAIVVTIADTEIAAIREAFSLVPYCELFDAAYWLLYKLKEAEL